MAHNQLKNEKITRFELDENLTFHFYNEDGKEVAKRSVFTVAKATVLREKGRWNHEVSRTDYDYDLPKRSGKK